MALNRAYLSVKSSDFVKVSDLGKGNFGMVSLSHYTGDIQAIKALGQYVAIKQIDPAKVHSADIKNETQNIAYLESRAAECKPTYFPRSCVVDVDDLIISGTNHKQVWIVSEAVAYEYDENNLPVKSCNLEEYMSKLAHDAEFIQTGKILGVENGLYELLIAMKNAVEQLHDIDVLHLDISPRNFLLCLEGQGSSKRLSVKIIDFGLSRISRKLAPLEVSAQSVPVRYMNKESLAHRTVSLMTDLYSLKAAMIELLGLACGKLTSEILAFPTLKKVLMAHNVVKSDTGKLQGKKLDGTNLQDIAFIKAFDRQTDIRTLELYLDNVIGAASMCQDKRGEQIAELLQEFRDYLTILPPTHEADFRKFDDSVFEEAIERAETANRRRSRAHVVVNPDTSWQDAAMAPLPTPRSPDKKSHKIVRPHEGVVAKSTPSIFEKPKAQSNPEIKNVKKGAQDDIYTSIPANISQEKKQRRRRSAPVKKRDSVEKMQNEQKMKRKNSGKTNDSASGPPSVPKLKLFGLTGSTSQSSSSVNSGASASDEKKVSRKK